MAAKANKTKQTSDSIDDFLNKVEPASRRKDALELCGMMQRLSGEAPKLWGPSIIGFGVHKYKYESGREGEMPVIGFSPRKPATVIYGLGAAEHAEEIAQLGKVTTGKGCVYIKSMADIDVDRLQDLITNAIKRRRTA